MELKRIIARDSRAATEKAMSLYGPDVLVIANQSMDGQTELIVAIDIEPEAPVALVREEPRASFQTMEPTRVHKPASGNMQAFEEAMALVRKTQAAVAEVPVRVANTPPRHEERSELVAHSREQYGAHSASKSHKNTGRKAVQTEPVCTAVAPTPAKPVVAMATEPPTSTRNRSRKTLVGEPTSAAALSPAVPRRRTATQAGVAGTLAVHVSKANAHLDIAEHVPTVAQMASLLVPDTRPAPQVMPSDPQTPLDTTAQAERGRELVDLVRAEIAALRQEFVIHLKLQQLHAGHVGHPLAEPLMAALDQAGAPAAMRALLLDTTQLATDMGDGLRRVRDALAAGLQGEALALPMAGVHALCGPSGAGKSLMAARWLQQTAFDHADDQLALISYCDQRPGAWSQTQMLATQIGVPAYRASGADTLKTLLNELSDRVLVVIDTPGTEPLRHAQTLLDVWPDIGLHTVLPADASLATVRRFWQDARPPWQSLLVSKIDESDQPWGLLQQLCNQRIPITGMSDSPYAHILLQRWRAEALLDRALALVGAMLPSSETPSLDGPPLSYSPFSSPHERIAPFRDAATQARASTSHQMPAPAIMLNLQGLGQRRHDPHGTAD